MIILLKIKGLDGRCFGLQYFVAGIPLLTEDGEKTIEEIEVGDYVYSSNPETGESDFKEVLWAYQRETYGLVYVFVGED